MGTLHPLPVRPPPSRYLSPEESLAQHEADLARAQEAVRVAEEALLFARGELHRCSVLVRLNGGRLPAGAPPVAGDASRLWAWASTLPSGHPAQGLLMRAAGLAERAEKEGA